jgi:small subunit ribosomal protein S6
MPETQQLAREYELIYIMRPSVSPSEARRVADKITEVVDKRGAKLTRVDNWGKRKLAYPIQKHQRGVFVYVKLVGLTDVVAELERNLRNLDEVMRYQTVRVADIEDPTAVQVDPEEVRFRDIEIAAEEEEDEPTFEERLGMSSRSRRSDDEGDEPGEDAIEDEEAATEDDAAESREAAPAAAEEEETASEPDEE